MPDLDEPRLAPDRRLGRRPSASQVGRSESLESRWARRRKADLPGYITSERLQAAIRCSMRDHSSSGALLQIVESNGVTVDDLPEELVLVLRTSREQTVVRCTVVRRFADGIGVRFKGMFKTEPVQSRRR